MAAPHRSPFAARPRSRAILVVAAVSSMKTSLSGSRSSWPSNQASRASFTSARCCSAACAVFFIGDPASGEEAPDRGDAEARAALDQLRLQFTKRYVGRRLDLGQDERGMRLDAARLSGPPLLRRPHAAMRLLTLQPAHCARHADIEALGRLPP